MLTRTTALVVSLMFTCAGAFAAENSFYGTWKSNLAKSHMTNKALIDTTLLVVIAPYGDNGWTRV